MNEILPLLLAWITGGLLGVNFFGGLWLTVRHCVSSQHPALWIFASLLLRMAITLTGFYWVANGDWQRLMLCLLGFIMMRFIVMRLTQSLDRPQET